MKDTVVEADKNGFPQTSPKLYLINTHYSKQELKNHCLPLYNYIQQGEELKIHQKYLASRRTPWYSHEQRTPAPYLCTYMGRIGNGNNVFRFIKNESKAIVANTYLMLYPKPLLQEFLKTDKDYCNIFNLLSQISQDDILSESRTYGGGLYKLEPKELSRVAADKIAEALHINAENVSKQMLFFNS